MSITTCSKCGVVVRLDRPTCPGCGAARVALTTVSTALATFSPTWREDMAIRIRSRLMWGDNPAEIREEFLKQGASRAVVDGMLRAAIDQREQFYRTLGRKNVIGGASLLVLGAVILVCVQAFFVGAVEVWTTFAGLAFPAGGLLLLFKGIRRMKRPGEGETTARGELGGH